ncbi:phospho-2-dehydro-3-deoxyheptonate aldolase [Clostridia bacterium]|nr:phospho-2-dehydro-3-deoxyheptonate aldolase [Clostridia bacterium]
MSLRYKKLLPTPEEIKERFPLREDFALKKKERDQEIKNILCGQDQRLLLIVGPCSADNEDSVCKYIEKLAGVQEKVKEKILFVPRIYTNKPRTTGEGYKGMVHQPDPMKEPDLSEGLAAIRRIHLKAFTETGLSCADEMLYPENWQYLSDLLSYVAVGARSVENQQHRLVSSGVDIPVGMKNPTGGDFSVMLNSIVAAQSQHAFIFGQWEVETEGNPLAHAILRGAVNKHGRNLPNYHYEDLHLLCAMYEKRNLKNPACIVDVNHSNSNKQYKEQIRIAKEVLHSRKHSEELKGFIKGLMIESYLVEGTQTLGENNIYGKSITDPCLGWEDSERLFLEIAEL